MVDSKKALLQPRDLQEAIEYLVKLFPLRPEWQKIIREKCAEFELGPNSEFHVGDREHSYTVRKVWIAEAGKSWDVWQTMLSNATFSAPAIFPGRVETGNVDQLLPGPLDLNPVLRLVDDATMTIYNVTLPRHIFFPGTINVQVTEEKDGVYVTVFGRGKGNVAWLNERGGTVLFIGIVERFRLFYLAKKTVKDVVGAVVGHWPRPDF